MLLFILGLLLAIPLSVIANLLTPWIKNKYALSSRKRALNRLRILERQLIDFDRRDLLKEILNALRYLLVALVFFMAGVTFHFAASYFWMAGKDRSAHWVEFLAFITTTPSSIFVSYCGGRIWTQGRSNYRDELEKAITSLKTKL